jgi:N-methylhydantoinase A
MRRFDLDGRPGAGTRSVGRGQVKWDVAVDVGGTFVDLVAQPSDDSGRRVAKRLRVSADPAHAVIEALTAFLADEAIDFGRVARLRHGTTIATNALLELRERPVALFTTRGFADVLTLGRQNRRDLDNPNPPPPVPPHICPEVWRFELIERIDSHGRVVTPLNSATLEAAINDFAAILERGEEPPSIAVCLLFAPLNPLHELTVGAALRRRWPSAHLSLSHQVDPRLREFERSLATVLDAYIRPATAGYLARLQRMLAEEGLPAPWLMRSLGGLAPLTASASAPATLAMSGPAAAALAVREVAAAHGGTARPAIGIDVGGTSTDISLVADGVVLASPMLTLGDLDLRVPSVDIASVAIGGGSLIRVTAGLLRVGPYSAGSFPGPACYGRGGTAPTLADAALLAGLLPARIADGLDLDAEAARRAVAKELGISPEDASIVAWDALKVAEAVLAEAVRRKALARGIDPRRATLVAAGGGGALHAAEIADRIGADTVVVPPGPGVLSAAGLLQAGLRDEEEQPVDGPLNDETLRTLVVQAADNVVALKRTLHSWPGGDGSTIVLHELEVVYTGQGHSLAIAYVPGADDAEALAARFDTLHCRLRGHAFGSARRIVALRSIATRPLGWGNTASATAPGGTLGSPSGHRVVAADPPLRCAVWSRAVVPSRARLTGPALIDAPDTTIWLPPGWRGEVQPDSTIILTAGLSP